MNFLNPAPRTSHPAPRVASSLVWADQHERPPVRCPTGPFLSPDPYVQAPDFSQSFNRYSYAWNNPLVYVDPEGELIWIIPNIGWSKSGGLNIGFSVIVGLPGVFSAQAGVGYNFKTNDAYAYAGASAGFTTAYVSASTSSGLSTGLSVGLSPYMGFPISTNFLSIGVNYSVNNNIWSGQFSAWTISKGGKWNFNPSVSAMIFPEHTTNLVRGQGFRNNNQVFERFVANGQKQSALDYFGFKGIYNPDKTRGNPAITDPITGEIFYGDYPFEGNFDRLALVARHEMRHSRNVLSGKYNGKEITREIAGLEEYNTYLYSYRNQGLYPQHGFNDLVYRINMYGWQALIDANFSQQWWHFIYKIPRKW